MKNSIFSFLFYEKKMSNLRNVLKLLKIIKQFSYKYLLIRNPGCQSYSLIGIVEKNSIIYHNLPNRNLSFSATK